MLADWHARVNDTAVHYAAVGPTVQLAHVSLTNSATLGLHLLGHGK